MKTSFIEEQVINTYPKIIQDHLKENKLDEQAWKDQIFKKSGNFSLDQRTQLNLSLEEQYSGFNVDSEIKENIDILKDPNTFTITTGHQLCLFTGPAYVIIKVLQTIKTCYELESLFSGCRFVPVFWLASEDHDFEEISQTNLFNNQIDWDYDSNESAVGEIISNELKPVLKRWLEMTGGENKAHSFNNELENALNQSNDLSGFYRHLFNSLFGKYGLVVFDANNKISKNSFSSILKEELSTGFLKTSVEKTIKEFKSGHKVQVNPRSCNLFYFKNKKRIRLERENDKLHLVEPQNKTSFNWEKEIENSPHLFSPNVLLRPLYQEYLLPNLAYIGGASEVAYWLELKHAFKKTDISFPKLIVRNSVFFMNKRTEKSLNVELGYDFKDIFRPLEELKKEIVLLADEGSYDIERIKINIKKDLEKVLALISTSDEGVKRSFNADFKTVENVLDKMQKKLIRYQKKIHSDKINLVKKQYDYFFPGGKWQERVFNFYHFQFNTEEDLIDKLLSEIKAFRNGALLINL